ncbi:nitrile hydratase subunit beta [Pseudonocardia sp. MCCB 268]|nr:nitrile hydratase subunit beta [Pseudonocardia cytotoxica]
MPARAGRGRRGGRSSVRGGRGGEHRGGVQQRPGSTTSWCARCAPATRGRSWACPGLVASPLAYRSRAVLDPAGARRVRRCWATTSRSRRTTPPPSCAIVPQRPAGTEGWLVGRRAGRDRVPGLDDRHPAGGGERRARPRRRDGLRCSVAGPEQVRFHADWEKLVLALTLAAARPGGWSIDESRHARESPAPARVPEPQLLRDLAGGDRSGCWSRTAWRARTSSPRAGRCAPAVPAPAPLDAAGAAAVLATGAPTEREARSARFGPGDLGPRLA